MFKPKHNCRSNKFQQICYNLYSSYLTTNSSFPITKYTPRKRSSGNIYYLKLQYFNSIGDIVTLYKIGYTSRTVAHRVSTIGVPNNIIVTIVTYVSFPKLVDCYNIEQLLHNKYVRYRYRGVRLLENGNSELYVKDVLGLD
jgi:hypothetical protein